MDSKKTNLTPELKEIYDRVMNTSSNAQQTTTPATPAAQAPQSSIPAMPTPQGTAPLNPLPAQTIGAPLNAPVPATPSMPGMPSIDSTMPSTNPTIPAAPIAPPTDSMASPSALNAPLGQPLPPTNQPQPPIGTSALVNTKAPQANVAKTGKPKISTPIIIAALALFIIAWIAIWALVFGIIPL